MPPSGRCAPDQHQAAAKGLGPAEALRETGKEGGRVGQFDRPRHVEDSELRLACALAAVAGERRDRIILCHGGDYGKTGGFSLSSQPGGAFPLCDHGAFGRAIVLRQGMERIHHHIDPADILAFTRGVDPEREGEPVPRIQVRGEGLYLRRLEKVVSRRRAGREGEELPLPVLAPQEIPPPVRAIAERGPQQPVMCVEPRTRLPRVLDRLPPRTHG